MGHFKSRSAYLKIKGLGYKISTMSKAGGEIATHMFPNVDTNDGDVCFDKNNHQLQKGRHACTHRGEDLGLEW